MIPAISGFKKLKRFHVTLAKGPMKCAVQTGSCAVAFFVICILLKTAFLSGVHGRFVVSYVKRPRAVVNLRDRFLVQCS